MDRSVEMIIAYRKTLLRLLDGLSIDALNAIPPGFNNNLIWNFGHVVVSQQTLCYGNANLKPLMEEAFILKYKRGTKPVKYIDKAEFEVLKTYSEKALIQLAEDLENNRFANLTPFVLTNYSLEVRDIQDVLKLLLHHEGLHLGYCMALKRAHARLANRSL